MMNRAIRQGRWAITAAVLASLMAGTARGEESPPPAGGEPASPAGPEEGEEAIEPSPAPDRDRPRTAEPAAEEPGPGAEGEGPGAPEAPSRTVLPDGTSLPQPTEQDLEGLRILEEEFERYMARARGFSSTVDSIVRREHTRRRARLVEEYERQIQAEETLLDQARLRAIEEFEAFLERYPNDPIYTPDAMFRLAELYYEDSYESYLDDADRRAEAEERREAGEDVEIPPEPVKDFSRTINLFRRLIAEYPDYRHIDGALYLLGFCLNETGRFEEARIAWLHLVCRNRFQYEGPIEPVEELEGEHPSLTLRAVAEEEQGLFVNPYTECNPVVAESRFLDETWLRIGEYHFDYDYSAHGVELAIASYRNAMRDPESPFYDKALYKLAWSYYRADRYVEAIRHFAMLVEFADERRATTGRTGSQMRPEAIQYLGICFAEDDWDNDAVPDPTGGIQRLQDPSLLPQDQPYTEEVYIQTADTYFDLGRYPEAIRVYEMVLERWPLSIEAPRIVERIAEAHTRNREFEEAISARRRLRDYGPEGEWAEANRDTNPERVREAGQLARTALYDDAVGHHQTAQHLRQQALSEENPELLRRAVEEYSLAAQGYRAYLEQYPNDPDAYEIGYNLAEAMYFSGNYREAAEAYAWVRDSNLDDRFREQAAFRTIKSLEAIRDEQIRAGTLTPREEPPEASGEPPQVSPIDIPQIIQDLNEARDTYVQLLPDSGRSPVFAYQTAQIFYRYGHWDQARERFAQIYQQHCTDHETGFYSWQNLVNMAGALDQLNETERLAQTQLERNCAPPSQEGTEVAEGETVNAREQAVIILRSAQFRHAQERFNEAREAEEAGRDADELYEQSAEMYLDAVRASPQHPDAARALNNAALAYEEVDRYESAMGVWRDIVEDYPDSDFVDTARFRLAYNAYRFFEYEEAVTHFSILARGSKSQDIRRDSILNTATILTNLEQYSKAAPYWRQYAEPEIAPDNEARAEAAFRAAEMAYKRRDWRETISEMRAYITEYRSLPEAGPYRVKAAYYIADAYDKLRQPREYYQALEGVIREFQASGEKAGSTSAEYAAEAQFKLVDRDIERLENFKIGGRAKQIDEQIQDGARRVAELEKAYKTVTAYRRPQWTVAAHYRIGYAYELLAKALLDSEPPTDTEQIIIGGLAPAVRRDLRRLSAAERRELLQDQIDMVEQQWRDEMITQVTGMEDRAVAEYELCVRAAREGNIVNEYTRQAYERLFAYRPEEYPLQREGRNVQEMDLVAPPSLASPSDPSPYPDEPRQGGEP